MESLLKKYMCLVFGALVSLTTFSQITLDPNPVWTTKNAFGVADLHYLNGNISSNGNVLVGAQNTAFNVGGPLELDFFTGETKRTFLNGGKGSVGGAKSVLELKSKIIFTEANGNGIRQVDNDWVSNLSVGHEAASQKPTSICTDGSFLFSNSQTNSNKIFKWEIVSQNPFQLAQASGWSFSGLTGEIEGISYYNDGANRILYCSNGGGTSVNRDILAVNANNGNIVDLGIDAPGLGSVKGVLRHKYKGKDWLLVTTSAPGLHIWELVDATTTTTTNPIYSFDDISLGLYNGNFHQSFNGISARANKIFIAHGNEIAAFKIKPLSAPSTLVISNENKCFGGNDTPLKGIGYNIQWYSDASLTNLLYEGDVFTPSVSVVGTHTFFVIDSIVGVGKSSITQATLEILEPVKIVSQTTDTSACQGADFAKMEVQVSGTKPYSFQWYWDGVIVNGETSNELWIAEPDQNTTGVFTCIVSNACTSVTSAPIYFNVIQKPRVSNIIKDQAICIGAILDLKYETNAVNSNQKYLWKWNDSIQVSTSESYTFTGFSFTDTGKYVVDIYNRCDTIQETFNLKGYTSDKKDVSGKIISNQGSQEMYSVGLFEDSIAHYWSIVGGSIELLEQNEITVNWSDENSKGVITYMGIYENGCQTDTSFTNVVLLNEFNQEIYSMFPNPASNYISIALKDAGKKDFSVIIARANGDIVLNEKITNTQKERLININVGSIPSGQYILKIKSNYITQSKKLVIIND